MAAVAGQHVHDPGPEHGPEPDRKVGCFLVRLEKATFRAVLIDIAGAGDVNRFSLSGG